MRVGIYIRVSTEEQTEGYSLSAQERACRGYADARAWPIANVYADEGWSGRRGDRPALQRLRTDIRLGKVQAVLVHKLDRLSRNVRLLFDLIEDFDRRDIVFVSVSEQMDFSTPIGRVMLANLGAFAEFYSRNLAAETSKGLTEKAEHGLWVGPVPLGYRKDEHGCLVPSEDAPAIQLIFELYTTGNYSYTDVADELNARGWRTLDRRTGARHVFGRESIRTILKNRAYLGYVSSGKREYAGQHEALVSESLWERARQIRESRTEKNGRYSVQAPSSGGLLTEVVYCYQCGERMWYHLSGRATSRRGYYVCSGRSRRTCQAPFGRADLAEEQTTELLRRLALPEAWQAAVAERAAVLLNRTRAKPALDHRAAKQRLERLKCLYLDGDIDDTTYRRERDRLQAGLAQAQSRILEPDLQAALTLLSNLNHLIDAATPHERQSLIRTIFSRLWIERREIKAITPTKLYLPLVEAIKNTHPADAGCVDGVTDGRQLPHPTPGLAPVAFLQPQRTLLHASRSS